MLSVGSKARISHRFLVTLFFVPLLLGLPRPSHAAEACNEKYHRNIASGKTNKHEREIIDRVRAVFGKAGRPLPSIDGCLMRLTKQETKRLSSAPDDIPLRLPSSFAMRQKLRNFGISDYIYHASAARSENAVTLAKRFAQWAMEKPLKENVHWGVSVAKFKGDLLGVVIFTKRIIRLSPFPRQLKKKGKAILTGRAPLGIQDIEICTASFEAKTDCGKPHLLAGGAFSHKLSFDKEGLYYIEALADTGEGRKVVSLFNVLFGETKRAIRAPKFRWERSNRPDKEKAARAALFSWLNRMRVKYGRKPLALSMKLSEIETKWLARHERLDALSHGDEIGMTAKTRVMTSGLSAMAVGENLGRAKRLDSIGYEWVLSPAHLATLLRPDFSDVGVALWFDKNKQEWLAGLLFAKLPEKQIADLGSLIELPQSLWFSIIEARIKASLPAARYTHLTRIAKAALAPYQFKKKVNINEMKTRLEKRLKAKHPELVKAAAVVLFETSADLEVFSGFYQHALRSIGIAAIRMTGEKNLALILLGQSDPSRFEEEKGEK